MQPAHQLAVKKCVAPTVTVSNITDQAILTIAVFGDRGIATKIAPRPTSGLTLGS
jgi:hypothetical protein